MRTVLTGLLIMMVFPCSAFVNVSDTDTVGSKRRGWVARLMDYLAETNRLDTTGRFDVSFLGGPYYSSENKLGIGLVAAGGYRRSSRDSLLSQTNLYGNVSVTGYYKLGVDGIQYVGAAAHRLVYDVNFESCPDKYWGIGYAANSRDENETSYKKWHMRLDGALLMRMLLRHLYVGPYWLMDYLVARDIPDAGLWNRQRSHTLTNSVGLKLEYDTRDSRFNAHKGICLGVDQLFAPRFLGNHYVFSSTHVALNGYTGVWEGGVLALRLDTRMTYGNTPWGLMSKVGGSYFLRGYWKGRYNDKCAAEATVELRQKVYRRHGVVVWAGIGEVFPKPRDLFLGHSLPNAGVGYRWEFKKDVNIRLDCGFGRHQNGIIFNLNEAF